MTIAHRIAIPSHWGTWPLSATLLAALAGCTPEPASVDCAALDLNSDAAHFSAEWDQERDQFAITANFSFWADNLRISGEPQVEGALLRDLDWSASYAWLEIVPGADVEEFRVTIPLTCGDTALSATYVLDVTGTPSDTGYIPFTVE